MTVELIGSLTDIEAGAVFEQDLDFGVVEIVGVVAQDARVDKIVAVEGVDMETELELSAKLVDDIGGEGMVGDADREKMAVDELRGEGAEDDVGMRGPAFDGDEEVGVVELGKTVEEGGGVGEIVLVEGVREEEEEVVVGVDRAEGTPFDKCTDATKNGQKESIGGDDGLVEVDLPIHEAARDDEFLDAVDALLVDDKFVVGDIEHVDDAVGADDALADAGEEAVAGEVVEAVDIELRRDELMEEMFVVGVVEDGDSGVELMAVVVVDALHKLFGEGLMLDIGDDTFGCMGEGAMSDVVKESGEADGEGLVRSDVDAFDLEDIDGAVHQIECAEGVAETGVGGARVDHFGEAQLSDTTETLEERVRDNVEDKIILDGEETIDRVVDNLTFIKHIAKKISIAKDGVQGKQGQ